MSSTGCARSAAPSSVHELPGRFPEPDADARDAAAAALAALGEGAAAVIDGLALPAFADCLAAAAPRRRRLVGFVHHPLALETGLPLETREALALRSKRDCCRALPACSARAAPPPAHGGIRRGARARRW